MKCTINSSDRKGDASPLALLAIVFAALACIAYRDMNKEGEARSNQTSSPETIEVIGGRKFKLQNGWRLVPASDANQDVIKQNPDAWTR
jgi:hypothetical protein